MKKVLITLVCILATLLFSYTESLAGNLVLKAGISKVDITPAESLYMGGYDESCRSGPSDGNSGKIYIRTLVFDNLSDRVAFIEIDIVSLPQDEYTSIREMVAAATGIPFGHIMLGCVHNHAAPQFSIENGNSVWYTNFRNNIVRSVKDAIADLEPVKIGGGTGKSFIAMNRRKKMEDTLSAITFDENNSSQSYGKYKTDNPVLIREMEGVVRLGASPGGSIDEEVGVMRIDAASGKPKAVFVNYACHGTSLGARNNKIGPEWNGHMLEYIEREVPGVMGIFAQGAAGDINPRFVGGLDGYRDDLQNTAELGSEIGQEVVRVYRGIVAEYPVGPEIKVVNANIVCPLKYDLVVKDYRETTIGVPTTIIKIDRFAWVTFPGEMFHEIGKKIKTGTHSQYSFIVGYCNGSLGYLPTQLAYSEGGYEPWASRFDPVTENIFLKGIGKMLAGLH